MKLLKIALVCALTTLALPAQAATVKLGMTNSVPDFADSQLNNGDTTSAGGFSLTFQNTQANFSSYAAVSFVGIEFGNFAVQIASVDLIFGIDTIIDRYAPDPFFRPGDTAGAFRLKGINGRSGLNSFASPRAFDMGTIPVFLAGETYTLTHTLSGPNSATLTSLHVSSPPPPAVVPLPASLPLLLAGLGAVALLRRRI